MVRTREEEEGRTNDKKTMDAKNACVRNPCFVINNLYIRFTCRPLQWADCVYACTHIEVLYYCIHVSKDDLKRRCLKRREFEYDFREGDGNRSRVKVANKDAHLWKPPGRRRALSIRRHRFPVEIYYWNTFERISFVFENKIHCRLPSSWSAGFFYYFPRPVCQRPQFDWQSFTIDSSWSLG